MALRPLSPGTGNSVGATESARIRPPATEPKAAGHRFDVDVLRLLASCTVILGHVSATFIHAVDGERGNGSGAYWTGHVFEAVNAFAVPVFFAIAGWGVLVGAVPRDEHRMWTRIIRTGVPLFVWTGIYLTWAWLRDRNEQPMIELAVDGLFASVQPAYHLWFLYVYLPVVAVLAFAVLVKDGRRPWKLGLALLAIATGPTALSTVSEVTGWAVPRMGWGFGTYSIVYAIGGALLLALPGSALRGRRWPFAALLPVAMAGVLWYHTQVHYVIPNAHLFVGTMTACVLLLVSRRNVPERLRPLIRRGANAAMGAYMIHVLFVEELVRPLVSADMSAPTATLTLLGMLTVVITLSYGSSLLWERLGLRRLLG
ncbi:MULTISPECIES: acyltransferase [unclassified Streptomyces]|uniref:acyltransferase n=1 Tax=unclassified Streptomyces TaxID=2593676 RepID=UPI0022B707A0|nr:MULTISPECIES: acyltransferase [unclassified Streptomyces]MCZ7414696.1 acyltransferase [Streptomyces sp. WMMC897]MCZ7431625.1 acyltransferase [Streptomyces sp. WMMC1477]